MPAICGCCGYTECAKCDTAFPVPNTVSVNLGGPYTCNAGGGNPCAFTMGGIYILKHPDTLLGFGQCNWTYKAVVCHPVGGSDGFLTLRFTLGAISGVDTATLSVVANYLGTQSTAGYQLSLAAFPVPRNCMAMLAAGLVLPRISLAGSLCGPSFPTSLTVQG